VIVGTKTSQFHLHNPYFFIFLIELICSYKAELNFYIYLTSSVDICQLHDKISCSVSVALKMKCYVSLDEVGLERRK